MTEMKDPTRRLPHGITVTSQAAPIFGVMAGSAPTTAARPARRQASAAALGYARPRALDLSKVEWPIAYQIRSLVIDQLAKEITPDTDEAERLQIGKRLIPVLIKQHSDDAAVRGDVAHQIPLDEREAYRKAVESATFGYGRWQPLLDDPNFEDMEMCGPSEVTMAYPDRVEYVAPVADTERELYEQVAFLAQTSIPPKEFSAAHPEVTLALGDRYRLYAKGFDTMTGDGPSIFIRQHKYGAQPLTTVAEGGMFPPHIATFLAASMRAKQSMLVSGNPGAGKTSLIRSLFLEIPPDEVVVTIESDAELFLKKSAPTRKRLYPCVAREGSLEAMGPDGRPVGEFTLDRHFRGALRMNPFIIIVGEVRGAEEALPMIMAMQQGRGTISTIHAQSAAATIERLVTALSQGGVLTVADAYRQIGDHISLIVHLERVRDTQTGQLKRYVSEIVEVAGHRDVTERSGAAGVSTNVVYDHRDPTRPLGELMSDKLRDALVREGWAGD
jgi:type IV secretory pathway ATPase VirB11/archaellum biosynthesis ATPase